jgi:hypothetical protein
MGAVQFYLPYDIAIKPTNVGVPGAQLFVYQPSSTTKRPVYSDATLTGQLSNPVIADGAGKFPAIYLDGALNYKIVIKDKGGAQIYSRDPYIPGVAPDSSALAPYQTACASSATSAGTSAAAAATSATNAAASATSATNSATSAAASIITCGASFSALPDGDGGLMPEMYGGLGNGSANDTAAFQSLATAIQAQGGGTINLRPGAVYIVGLQSLVNNGTYMFKGQNILTLNALTKTLVINGNGAIIRLAPGLKFGTFNAAGGSTSHTLPYTGGERSTPLAANGIISITNCTGKVVVRGFEIDGNEANASWGGPFGDTGWQIEGDGLFLQNNSGGEDIDIYSHHNLRDGGQIIGPVATEASPKNGSRIRLRGDYNTRNAVSLTAGRGYRFVDGKFNNSGQGTHSSAPGAGVDIEAESGIIRDVEFENCEFSGNAGVACVSDGGDVQRVSFKQCNFIGQHNWAHWIVKPFFSFEDCLFVGCINFNITRLFGDVAGVPKSALPRFLRCRFTDNGAYSPSGTVANVGTVLNSVASLDRALFDQCHFRAGYNINIGSVDGRYRDCSFDLGASGNFLVGASFAGVTTITADAANSVDTELSGSQGGVLQGQIVWNGADARRGTVTNNLASLADGASTTFTVPVRWARMGRDVFDVTFDSSLLGLKVSAWCSTNSVYLVSAGVVTVQLTNNTGGAVDLPSGTWTVVARDKDPF